METPIKTSETVKRDVATPSGVDWIGITCYIVLAFGISWATWITLGALGVPFTIRAALGMFGPALACLLVRLIRREGFSDAGLRLVRRGGRVGFHYIEGYVVPLVLIALGV